MAEGSFDPIWSVEGDVIRGPGVFDMKAGFIQALFALKGFSGSVALIATSDEGNWKCNIARTH
ncbi:MAG: hypothetical protein WDO06_08805 [Actinomycetota bacterium]